MNEGIKPGEEIFVDEKQIGFLSDQGAEKNDQPSNQAQPENHPLSVKQREKIDAAVEQAQQVANESKLTSALKEDRTEGEELPYLYQAPHSQMRYGRTPEWDTPLKMLRMEGPGEKFNLFQEPPLTSEQIQTATEIAEKFGQLNSEQLFVLFRTLDTEKLKEAGKQLNSALFVKETIARISKTKDAQNKIVQLMGELLKQKQGLSAEPDGGIQGLVDRILKDTEPQYPLPRVDIGSGLKAINDSDGKKNYP